VLPIPGHLIVPDCSCPGSGTHTRDSGTVPGIPGQLVTLFSLIGRNVLYCSDASDVLTNNTRLLSDTIHSRARSEVTEAQFHEVDLLFECVLIRDGQAVLSCLFPRSDIQSILNYTVF